MKVCHCFTTHVSLIFLEGQLQFMQEHDVDLHIAVPFNKDLDLSKYPEITFHFISMARKVSFKKDFISLFKLIALFKNKSFDIIHLHTPKASLLGSLAARMLFHKRVIYHLHGLVAIKNNKPIYNLTNLFERLPFLLSNFVLSVSPSMKEYCIKNKLVNLKKIQVLGNGTINGIDAVNKFNPSKASIKNFKCDFISKNKLKNKFIVGFVGRVCVDKGFFDFVNVANELAASFSNCMFLIVGVNELGRNVIDVLRELAKFQYIYVDSTDTPENYIAILDVLVLPSSREGFGLVAAEASALCVPVVAYDIIGICNAVVNGETGTLVEPADKGAMYNAIRYYYLSPNTAKYHGLQGREYILTHFPPSVIWQEQLKFYNSIL